MTLSPTRMGVILGDGGPHVALPRRYPHQAAIDGTEHEALDIARPIAEALEAAREKGIVTGSETRHPKTRHGRSDSAITRRVVKAPFWAISHTTSRMGFFSAFPPASPRLRFKSKVGTAINFSPFRPIHIV
jgi:hypothetical protein